MSVSSVTSNASVGFHGRSVGIEEALDEVVRDLQNHLNHVQLALRQVASVAEQDLDYEEELKLSWSIDEWNNLRGPKEEWQIDPNRINTFKELPSSNHLVEAADTPYSQAAAVREVVATTTGGAIEPKKSILDIARSFVLTAINPAVKDWWARRVNSLDQLEAIAATRGLTGQETMLRDNILSEITRESSNVDNLAINAPEYKEPAAPLAIEEIKRAAAQGYYTAQKTLEQKMLTPRTKPAASPVPATPEVKRPMPEPAPGPSVTIPPPVKFHLPRPADSPVATGPVIRTTIGPPGAAAGPNGTTVEINVTQTAQAFRATKLAMFERRPALSHA